MIYIIIAIILAIVCPLQNEGFFRLFSTNVVLSFPLPVGQSILGLEYLISTAFPNLILLPQILGPLLCPTSLENNGLWSCAARPFQLQLRGKICSPQML